MFSKKEIEILLKFAALLGFNTRIKKSFEELQFLRSLSYFFHLYESFISSINKATEGIKMF